nr:nucleotidyltransferase domain-containing protein [Aminobacter aminovorans]
MDLNVEQQREIIGWASAIPEILAVRLYGSRARGTSHQQSDVDLAITLAGDESEQLQTVVVYFRAWTEELSTRLSIRAHLEPYLPGTCVKQWSDEHSVLLFDRPPV